MNYTDKSACSTSREDVAGPHETSTLHHEINFGESSYENRQGTWILILTNAYHVRKNFTVFLTFAASILLSQPSTSISNYCTFYHRFSRHSVQFQIYIPGHYFIKLLIPLDFNPPVPAFRNFLIPSEKSSLVASLTNFAPCQ